MIFNSAYNRKRPPVRCCTCKTQEEFIFDKVNNCLVKSGKTINTYERTQSHHEQCNINNQLRRYLVPGGSLPSRVTSDIDISNIPDNLVDFSQTNFLTEKFNKLPAEFRELFSNDINAFTQALAENKLDTILAGYFSASSGAGTGTGASEGAGTSSGADKGVTE